MKQERGFFNEADDHLLIKILNGTATESEIGEFALWIKNPHNEHYFAQFKEIWHLAIDSYLHESGKLSLDNKGLDNFTKYIRASKRAKRRAQIAIWSSSAAAVIILATILFNISPLPSIITSSDFSTLAFNSDSVKIEINDGESVKMFKGSTGTTNLTPQTAILNSTTEASPNKESQSKQNNKAKKSYTSVSTPPGERVTMVLSDGTKVYLTSNSYLRYPNTFESNKREVTLVGRAYFEVSKSDKPFLVKTSDMEVEVLGTSFDVESRYNRENSNVILVEGSVKIITKNGTQIIKPNEQFSLLKSNNQSIITNVDSQLLTMWKDGVLVLKGQTFSELIESLSTWYGVTIINNTTLSQKERFNGRFDREDIEAAIKAVCISTRTKYKISDGNLILENNN